jgi:hypothetical protein
MAMFVEALAMKDDPRLQDPDPPAVGSHPMSSELVNKRTVVRIAVERVPRPEIVRQRVVERMVRSTPRGGRM